MPYAHHPTTAGQPGQLTGAIPMTHSTLPPLASPTVRRLAEERHVDLYALAGTGLGGRITYHDVELAAGPATPAAPPRPAAPAPPAPVVAPAADIPHHYLSDTVDLGAAMDWLRERNHRLPSPQRLLPAALLLKATALAARAVPELNGFWRDGRFVPASAVHLGVALSLPGGGPVVPVIHHAADLDLPTLTARLHGLTGGTRPGAGGRSDATITVSTMVERGSEAVFGVVYPPQVALVGFGRVVERPWAVGGVLGVRPLVTMSLAADHRASDGATGARFLDEVARLLQRPQEL